MVQGHKVIANIIKRSCRGKSTKLGVLKLESRAFFSLHDRYGSTPLFQSVQARLYGSNK